MLRSATQGGIAMEACLVVPNTTYCYIIAHEGGIITVIIIIITLSYHFGASWAAGIVSNLVALDCPNSNGPQSSFGVYGLSRVVIAGIVAVLVLSQITTVSSPQLIHICV